VAGYAPLFSSLTTGTLCGRWPDIGLWPIVLSLADKDGVVDVTPAFIAGVTGLPHDDVVACMRRFCEPDPYSRSNAENGARLVLLDPHRDWGWQVVNFARYREKARLAAKAAREVETGANRERMGERRTPPPADPPPEPAPTAGDRRGPPVTAADRPSNANSNSNPDGGRGESPRGEVAAEAAAPAPAPVAAQASNRKRRGKLGHFVPEDWTVPIEDYRWAIEQGYSPEFVKRETERFCDHEFKTPRSDWVRAWRNWISRDPPKGARSGSSIRAA
jgi:hypothetical protein